MSPVPCGLFYDAWKDFPQRPSDDPSSLWFVLRRMESFPSTSLRCHQFLVVCFTTHGKFSLNVLQMPAVPCGLFYDAWKVFPQRPSDVSSSLWFVLRRMERFPSTSFRWPQFLEVCFMTYWKVFFDALWSDARSSLWLVSRRLILAFLSPRQSVAVHDTESNAPDPVSLGASISRKVRFLTPVLIFRGRSYPSVTRYLRRCASSGADVNICRRG
jgi:hypothetical protein